MKKKVFVFVFILLGFLCVLDRVFANAEGGGGSGSGAARGSCSNTFCLDGFEVPYENGDFGSAYKIQLVYYEGTGGTWTILSEGIIYSGNNSSVESKINTRSETYIDTPTASTFAQYIHDIVYNNGSDEAVTNWFNANGSANFIQLASEMGVHKSELTKKSTKTRALNSKGYRIIAQKLVAFNSGFQSRKEMARFNDYNYGSGCYYGLWDVTPGSCVGTFRDLHTAVDDIGISAPSSLGNRHGIELYWGYDRLKAAIENSNSPSGSGYGIYEFENPYENDYDYSIDAACQGCNNKNSKNIAYIIQDTNDWKAIKASSELKTDNVQETNTKNYYIQSSSGGYSNVYCREEYHIYFPNTNTKIYVESGRYFTVNKEKNTSSAIPNFEPIKVEKIKECRSWDSNQAAALQTYKNKFEKQKINTENLGVVKLKYTEKYNKSKYNKEDIELVIDENDSRNKKENAVASEIINDGNWEGSTSLLRVTTTAYYTLKSGTYRYVENVTGLSSYNKPNDSDLSKYIDLGTENFPISYQNTKGSALGFKYTLPEKSLMKKAFNKNNDYLKISSDGTFYKKIKEGKFEDYQSGLVNKTACYKLYSSNTSKCINERVSNSAGNCYGFITNENYDKYTCNINVGTNDDPDNSKVKKCKMDIDPTTEKITYYGKDGNIVSFEQYNVDCPNTCTNCSGGVCCPDTTMVCPDEDGNCPVTGNKIIYRTIDLNNPFPAANGTGRSTGSNWCNYNIKTGKLTCDNNKDNPVVNKHIITNRNTSSESIYQKEPLYKVTLTPSTIKDIRSYNSSTNYDDNSLQCSNSATYNYTCKSTFLRSDIAVTGICSSGNYSSLSTCAEAKS